MGDAAIECIVDALAHCTPDAQSASASSADAVHSKAVDARVAIPTVGLLRNMHWSLSAVCASSLRPHADGIAPVATVAIDVVDPDGAEGYDRASGARGAQSRAADGDVGGIRRVAMELSVSELKQLRVELARVA